MTVLDDVVVCKNVRQKFFSILAQELFLFFFLKQIFLKPDKSELYYKKRNTDLTVSIEATNILLENGDLIIIQNQPYLLKMKMELSDEPQTSPMDFSKRTTIPESKLLSVPQASDTISMEKGIYEMEPVLTTNGPIFTSKHTHLENIGSEIPTTKMMKRSLSDNLKRKKILEDDISDSEISEIPKRIKFSIDDEKKKPSFNDFLPDSQQLTERVLPKSDIFQLEPCDSITLLSPSPSPQLIKVTSVTSDEELARQLQSQFDEVERNKLDQGYDDENFAIALQKELNSDCDPTPHSQQKPVTHQVIEIDDTPSDEGDENEDDDDFDWRDTRQKSQQKRNRRLQLDDIAKKRRHTTKQTKGDTPETKYVVVEDDEDLLETSPFSKKC